VRRDQLAAQADALTLMASDLATAQALLRGLAARAEADPATKRRLIRGIGLVGDSLAMPYLLSQCRDDRVARLAGEAISTMTGADLARQDLERKPPEGVPDGTHGGPTEDPADEDVALDEDESLPWPDADRLQAWWQREGGRWPAGRRHFMGHDIASAGFAGASAVAAGAVPAPSAASGPDAAVARDGIDTVLAEGHQRQRELAAQWRLLLQPGSKLFPTRAPTRRQRRWLGLPPR
jgi:uncharacterized protein (TIGR02270 family)